MSDFLLGQHAEAIAELKKDVAELGEKMDRVVAFVDRIDGGWKTAGYVLTIVGAIVGAASSLLIGYVKKKLWG